VIKLPLHLGKDFLAQVTGGTPRVMLHLKRYLDTISPRKATVDDVNKWVLSYSEELFAELQDFVESKLLLPGQKAAFARFLRWFMDPSADYRPVPEGSTDFLMAIVVSVIAMWPGDTGQFASLLDGARIFHEMEKLFIVLYPQKFSVGVIWDMGLGYRTENKMFAATSVPAARAMMLYYANVDVLPSLVATGKGVRLYSSGLISSIDVFHYSLGSRGRSSDMNSNGMFGVHSWEHCIRSLSTRWQTLLRQLRRKRSK